MWWEILVNSERNKQQGGSRLIKVIKKDGTLEDYNEQNIIDAVNKSARRDNYNFTEQDYQLICNTVLDEIDEEEFENEEVPVDFIHNIVEKTLLNIIILTISEDSLIDFHLNLTTLNLQKERMFRNTKKYIKQLNL